MSELILTIENFEEEVLKSDTPVLVDFWAPWCGPCKMISPIIAEIAAEYEDQVKIGKINVDEEEELARKYYITSIPTLILFRNGEPIKNSVGVIPKDGIISMFKESTTRYFKMGS